LATGFQGENGQRRFAALVDDLDKALDRWWSDNALPAKPLLREGLLALEAGHDLDEGHRTLLLRAALAHGKGLLTALRHQTDPERTGFLIKEAVLDVWSPLSPVTLWRLKQEDPQSGPWVTALTRELEDELVAAKGVQRELAARALATLTGKRPPTTTSERTAIRLRALLRSESALAPKEQRRSYWSPGRLVVLLVLALLVIFAVLLPGRPVLPGSVLIAGGEYTLPQETSSAAPRTVTLTPFAIDRWEVTNANYRQCVLVGQCPAPHTSESATRPDYWTNPAYDDYPVVHVPWAAAQQFCGWLGKRLPTADEWQVAASVAPVTGLTQRYPWGDLYQPQVANLRETLLGDTQPVGAFSPFGDSPAGLADMAGNVAEWTATPATDGDDRYVVKGGAYVDGAETAWTGAVISLAANSATPTVGFRCAAD
jgi:formylglycine-generating enzyme required for sulfatase activity